MSDSPSTGPQAAAGQPDAAGIGPLLRASRQRVGEDLRDVAAMLRIRYPYLEAIESSRFSELPGQTYAVGFVRAYAEHLGLDSEEVVRRFKAEIEDGTKNDLHFPTPVAETGIPGGALVFVGLVVAVLAYGGWYLSTTEEGFLSDLVAPLPERLAALVSNGEEAAGPPDEAPPPATEPAPASESAPASAPGTAAPAAQPTEPAPPAEAAGTPAPETSAPETSAPEPAPAPPAVAAASATVAQNMPQVPEPEPVDQMPSPPEEPAAPAPVEPAATPQSEPEPPAQTAGPAGDSERAAVAAAIGHVDEPTGAATAPADEAVSPGAAETPPESTAEPAAEMTAPETTPEATPEAARETDLAATGQAAQEPPSRITVRATTNSWIEVRDDFSNTRLMTGLLAPGEEYRVPDQTGLSLHTGNAGGLVILVDGEVVPSIGGDGAVRRGVQLDPDLLRAGTAVR